MIADPVRLHAHARPDAAAIVTEHDVWSWADLDARVGACAGRLRALAPGPPAGDVSRARRVGLAAFPALGVVAQTSPDLVVLLLGALRAGVVAVPLPPRWPPAALAEAAARLGVVIVGPDVPAIAGVQMVGIAALTAPRSAPGEAGPVPLRRPWTVVHTSGSSGEPKAALHTVGSHVWSARGVSERLGLRAGDRWLLDLPLAHVGGLGVVVRCVLAGASMAIPEPGTTTAEALRRFAPTHASLVSTQLVRLLRDAPGETFPGLWAVLLGGGTIAPGLLDAAVAAGLPVCVGYGMTETASTVTMTAPGAPRDDLATSGTLLRHRDLRVSADGEILVRGETLFAGYVTAETLHLPLTSEGWFATGDLGHLDAAGRLVVDGRRGNRFVSGGENVQPEAVEAALARLPGVAEAVVVPVADAEWGARPVAFVRPTGAMPPAAGLAAGLRETLPGFAVPVAFYAWDGPAGMKPDRRALAAEAKKRWAVGGGR